MISQPKKLLTAVWLATACIVQISGCGKTPRQVAQPEPCIPFPGPLKILSEPLSIEQVEAISLEKMKKTPSAPQVPFGYSNEQWLALKAQIRPGYSLHEFETDITGGHVLMRNDCYVGRVVSWVR